MPDTPRLPKFITEFVSKASPEQRKAMFTLLEEFEDSLGPYLTADSDSSSEEEPTSIHQNKRTISPSSSQEPQYVIHVEQLPISPDISEGVLQELKLMKLRTKGKKGQVAKVKTQWLMPCDESRDDVRNPKLISNYHFIPKILDIVNSHHSTSGDMNACLVSCMSTKDSSLSYHADHEDMIDQNSDICTVSFGPARTLDFLRKDSNHGGRKGSPLPPEFSVPATNHSMNVMKAGCQSHLLHRVPPGKVGGVRYSLSFRKVLTQQPNVPLDQHGTSSSIMNDATNVPSTHALNKKKKTVLLAGDSYFERLDVDKLGKGKQSVCKVAKGGRKIEGVLKSLEDFSTNNPDFDVVKLFMCVGTNDIRNCRERGVLHLKTPLQSLFTKAKELFPNAKVYVQSLLPIPSNGNRFSDRNVLAMNRLIFNLCSKYRLFFVDAFSYFLNRFGNRNVYLFPKFDERKQFFDIHPNPKGMGVLARQYIFLIHSKRFNPLAYN